MRNLRKLLAVVVTVALMVTMSIVPVFGADAAAAPAISADAKACADLGMLLGAGAGVTADYTATQPSRIQAAILFLRLKGLEADAKAFTGTENFSDVKADWMKPYTAYLKANPTLGWVGSDGKFDPDSKVTAAQYYKVVLNALGYVQKADAAAAGDFEFKDVITFAASKGLSKAATATTFTVDNLATATVEGLKVAVKDSGKTLMATLVDAGKVTADKATAAGLYAAAQALDLDNAVALTSKIVEVKLNTAVTSVSKSDVTVKDTAGKAIAVVDAKLAPYDADGKTALFTLEADTATGTYYTLTTGSVSKNFGGRSADTTKPTLNDGGVVATDYNEATLDFNEPVQADGAVITIAEKYGNKASLAVSKVQYGSSNTQLKITTAAQNGATLYAVTVSGVKDWAGNVIDLDTSETFGGIGASTSVEKFIAVKAEDYNKLSLQFDVNVDPATIVPGNFTVTELYGANASVAVQGARLAKTGGDDHDVNGSDVVLNNVKKHVVLTVEGTMKDNVQYKVTVSGVKTLYGVAMSTTTADTYKTFTGMKKPSDPFTFDSTTPTSATSNTEVTVVFKNKVDKTKAQNIATYSIALAYGAKTPLAVKKAVLQSDNKTVKITTDTMANNLYQLTVTGLVDIYGNNIKTADSGNIVTFSGVAIQEKIKSFSIARNTANDYQYIILTFDKSVGATATDVSHYTIDGGVGYPNKAEVNWDTGITANMVRLTIPKTTASKLYTVTVKNLENSDGAAMDAAGITSTFIGLGNDAALPQIQAVIATDNQTLKIYFDRSVTDPSLEAYLPAQQLWTKETTAGVSVNKLVTNSLQIGDKNDSTGATNDLRNYRAAGLSYAWQDPDNTNVLNVRVPQNDAFKSVNKISADNAFRLFGNGTTTLTFDADHKNVKFAPNEDEPTGINVDSVMAVDNKTIRVYFNQPTYGSLTTFATVATSSAGANPIAFSTASAIDKTKRIYDFSLNGTLSSTSSYYLYVNPTGGFDVANSVIKDTAWVGTNGIVGMKDDDTSTGNLQHVRQFAGSNTDPASISEVSVIMTDKKHVVVYYPQPMDATTGTNSATNKLRYTFVKASGADLDSGAVINDIKYDSDPASSTYNTATITLKDALAVGSGQTLAKLKFDNGTTTKIQNKAGTQFVKDGSSQLVKQFALSTVDAPKLKVASAVYDGTTGELTITLNQKAMTAAAGTAYQGTPTQVATDFTIKVQRASGDNYTTVAVANIAAPGSALVSDMSTTVADDTIVVKLQGLNIMKDGIGTVILPTGTTNIVAADGEAIDGDAVAVTFAQKETR